jgi:hypothetical protein
MGSAGRPIVFEKCHPLCSDEVRWVVEISEDMVDILQYHKASIPLEVIPRMGFEAPDKLRTLYLLDVKPPRLLCSQRYVRHKCEGARRKDSIPGHGG